MRWYPIVAACLLAVTQANAAELKLYLNATDSDSYSGSGQVWNDLTNANNDAVLGSSAGDTSGDPAFTGTAGSSSGRFDYGAFASGRFHQISGFSEGDNTTGTIELWALSRADTGGGPQNFFATSQSTFRMVLNDNQYHLLAGGGSIKAGSTTGQVNQLVHIVVTHDGSQTRLFLNNSQLGSTLTSSFWFDDVTGDDVFLGALSPTGQVGFPGELAVVRYYDAALSTAEINTNFTEGITGENFIGADTLGVPEPSALALLVVPACVGVATRRRHAA